MTPDAPVRRRRCAVVSLGARAQLYTEAPTSSHADRVDLAGFCDVNTHRMAVQRVGCAAAAGTPAKFGTVDCRRAKCIALTFDAGLSENSARLLDGLKEKKVPATFFLLGKRHIEKYPELVKRMAAEGREVASHTWDHKILTEIKPTEIREELEKPDDAIEKLTGKRPTLMRPPQGRTNDTVHKICRELGLSEVLWSVTAKEYKTYDPKVIQQRVLKQSSRDGIVLLHDLYPGTAPVVPGIIDALKVRASNSSCSLLRVGAHA
ncbi:polysaccharide deacetylase family protein [Streptomyces mirabilis]|uniref:polysaccharide deacetylase family protein n=1 Tax=Streptomyces mirabilis TaxID=68239 RepID=UPI003660CD9D